MMDDAKKALHNSMDIEAQQEIDLNTVLNGGPGNYNETEASLLRAHESVRQHRAFLNKICSQLAQI